MDLRTEDLANESLEDLKARRKALREQKKDMAGLFAEAESPFGKAHLERKEAELQTIREDYNGIKITDTDDREVILCLLAVQLRERAAIDEIGKIINVKKVQKKLDKQLALCNTAVKSKETAANTLR